MRLLVSVRSGAEAVAAVAGGADIVDAKEPSRGSLGPVDPATLGDIAAALPAAMPLSAALGDFHRPEEAAAAIGRLPPMAERSGPIYLKLGFAGVGSEDAIDRILCAAVEAAGSRGDRAGLVVAAYADHEEAGTLGPATLASVAARRGAVGVLLDTRTKDGRDLFHWMPRAGLDRWVAGVREAGLLPAVAGSLDAGSIERLIDCGAEILGVRGAACDGGRGGLVSAARVRAVKLALSGVEPRVEACSPGGERMLTP